MADKPNVRDQERSIWTEDERLGREARAAESARQMQNMTQADRDAATRNPTEGLGI
jgi:hypothetical protein